MTEQKPPEGSVAEEIKRLGQNLSEALRAAWDSPERKRLQQEIGSGLVELGNTMKEGVRDFGESQAGQRIRTEAEQFGQRVRSGEVEGRVRQELLSALRIANEQLQNVVNRMSEDIPGSAPAGTSAWQAASGEEGWPQAGGAPEVHPDDVEVRPSETGHAEVHPDDIDK